MVATLTPTDAAIEAIREQLAPWLESGLPLDAIKITLRRKPSGRVWKVGIEAFTEREIGP